jgi:lysophospholipase L1-like esterase
MHKGMWYALRMALPCVLVLALVPVVAPLAFGAMHSSRAQPALVGPKAYYLALGDSLAFGYQPDFNWVSGYANDFFSDLQKHGVQHYDNLACPGESIVSFIHGGCQYALLRKYFYRTSQLQEAVKYLHDHAGQVSPVTLDIGANDLIPDLNMANCSIKASWQNDLTMVNDQLKNVILPQLIAAMTVNGQMTGDLILLNYYDPYQDICPNTLANIQTFNQDLAADAGTSATVVDVFSAFAAPPTGTGATSASTSHLCLYTWMCGNTRNTHPNRAGYSLMAEAIERAVKY